MHFNLTEAKNYKTIQVVLSGGANVLWTETYTTGYGQHTQTHTVTYRAEETYVNQALTLWKSQDSPDGKIGPGIFDLTFQFTVPQNCLASFKGNYGTISYALYGHIKTGLLRKDHSLSAPITINRLALINLPKLILPATRTNEKVVGCCCAGTNIEFTASLTCTGFCISQPLPLNVSVVNGSGRQLRIRASIQRFSTYRAQGHVKYDVEKMAFIVSPRIPAHSQYTWDTADFIVPTVEPSFEGSSIISMYYVLKVTIVIPWAKNPSLSIPITLGNVPMNN